MLKREFWARNFKEERKRYRYYRLRISLFLSYHRLVSFSQLRKTAADNTSLQLYCTVTAERWILSPKLFGSAPGKNFTKSHWVQFSPLRPIFFFCANLKVLLYIWTFLHHGLNQKGNGNITKANHPLSPPKQIKHTTNISTYHLAPGTIVRIQSQVYPLFYFFLSVCKTWLPPWIRKERKASHRP